MDFDSFEYEDRIVAFIDILGWSAAVRAAGPKGAGVLGWVVKLLRRLEETAASHKSFAPGFEHAPVFPGLSRGYEATQFSDCIVISIPASDDNALWTLELILAQACSFACQSGFLLRGGVVRGPIFHKERMVYGPALIDAVRLEQRAIYPRICVLDPILVEKSKYWQRGRDGVVFFDYLNCFGATPFQYRSLIARGLYEANNFKVLRKYTWAARYYDRANIVEEFGPIVIGEEGHLFAIEEGAWPVPKLRQRRRSQ